MSFQNQGLARLRGILVGAAIFCGVLWASGSLPGLAFDQDVLGRWLDDRGILSGRALALIVASVMAGIGSSVATRDYVSGTSILALTLGATLASFLAPTREGGFSGDEFEEGIALFLEVLLGLAAILAGYFAAWQTDLRWVLPRRPGPPYQKKVVGPRELFLVNVPIMFLAAGLVFGGFAAAFPLVGAGIPGLLSWTACSGLAGFALLWLFPIRSTFFLWTAPGLSVLLALIIAVSAPDLDAMPFVLGRLGPLPFNLFVPLGAAGATLAYLLQRKLKAKRAVGGP